MKSFCFFFFRKRRFFLPLSSQRAADAGVEAALGQQFGAALDGEIRVVRWHRKDYDVGWFEEALQLAAALPNVELVAFIGGSPYVDGILEEPFVLDADGYLPIPQAPGLGVSLSREKLARFTPDAAMLFQGA